MDRAYYSHGISYMAIDVATLTAEASSGDTESQLQLADMYENGFGVPLDYGQAAYWYRKAAEQGSAGAQTSLGQMYIKGKGVAEELLAVH